ncbi:hypothetical protein [Methanoregula sp.]|uniref:hypothetical protein n=1 Tax=Methanoregula sp. TaxID=2052170 RepID=UPI003BB1268A
MKTKLWIIVGVLIIAFAAMVAPVMADGTVTTSGNQPTNASVSILNASTNFGSFTVGTDTISPSHYNTSVGFPVIDVYSNENQWYVKVNGNNAEMTNGVYTLANPLTIQNATPVTDITGVASPLTLTTSATQLLMGSPVDETYVPLVLQQPIIPTDTAANGYQMVITVAYSDTA